MTVQGVSVARGWPVSSSVQQTTPANTALPYPRSRRRKAINALARHQSVLVTISLSDFRHHFLTRDSRWPMECPSLWCVLKSSTLIIIIVVVL